jgi:hypothetical protein
MADFPSASAAIDAIRILYEGRPLLRVPLPFLNLEEVQVSVRLKIEDSLDGLVATISQRDDAGKVIGHPSVVRVGTKEEAKQQAKSLARSLGLKVYGIVDKTGASDESHPWLVPGVGKSL